MAAYEDGDGCFEKPHTKPIKTVRVSTFCPLFANVQNLIPFHRLPMSKMCFNPALHHYETFQDKDK